MTVEDNIPKVIATMGRYVDAFGLNGQDVVKRQGGLLMRDLVEALPPKNKARLTATIKRDVGRVFAPSTVIQFPDKQQGHGDIVWLNASPSRLTGTPRTNFQLDATPESMASVYSSNRKGLGDKYAAVGSRGKQRKRLLNRIIVRKAGLLAFAKQQADRIGKMKASFATGWDTYGPKGHRPAAWIMKHVEKGTARGSAAFQFIQTASTFILISNANGIESETAKAAAARALHNRLEKMKAEIALVVKGVKNRSDLE